MSFIFYKQPDSSDCGPCAKAHEVLHKLVERNDIGLTVQFTVKAGSKEDKKLQAVEYMFGLCARKDAKYIRKLLHDWYAWMDMEKFTQSYPGKPDENTNRLLLEFESWITESKIEFTPTVFISGFQLPKQYQVNDLTSLIRAVKIVLSENKKELVEK